MQLQLPGALPAFHEEAVAVLKVLDWRTCVLLCIVCAKRGNASVIRDGLCTNCGVRADTRVGSLLALHRYSLEGLRLDQPVDILLMISAGLWCEYSMRAPLETLTARSTLKSDVFGSIVMQPLRTRPAGAACWRGCSTKPRLPSRTLLSRPLPTTRAYTRQCSLSKAVYLPSQGPPRPLHYPVPAPSPPSWSRCRPRTYRFDFHRLNFDRMPVKCARISSSRPLGIDRGAGSSPADG